MARGWMSSPHACLALNCRNSVYPFIEITRIEDRRPFLDVSNCVGTISRANRRAKRGKSNSRSGAYVAWSRAEILFQSRTRWSGFTRSRISSRVAASSSLCEAYPCE